MGIAGRNLTVIRAERYIEIEFGYTCAEPYAEW